MDRRQFLSMAGASAVASALGTASTARRRPNIILMMADDMGFSDIGCYGSEIHTPNIDALARTGVRFTQFYNTARCCPTRASLLTGLYAHQAGVGHMVEGKPAPGYQGYLNDKCVTIAEALRPAGYFTAMTGKWHVGQEHGVTPANRGFDRAAPHVSVGHRAIMRRSLAGVSIAACLRLRCREMQVQTPGNRRRYLSKSAVGAIAQLLSSA